MLSSTYVQVAVVNENRLIKRQLDRLKEKVEAHDTEFSELGQMMDCLGDIYEKCRTARFESIVLPVVREAKEASRTRMEEFASRCDRLAADYAALVASCPGRRQEAGGPFTGKALKERINTFIHSIEAWLDCKENSFFDWAKDVLSDEKWFEIAESLIETEWEFVKDEWDWDDFHGESLLLPSDGYADPARETEYRL